MSWLAALQIFGAVKSMSDADRAASQIKEAGEANAQLAEVEGAEQERRYVAEQKRLQGQMVVNYAKSGVVLEGTPLEVMAEAANEADIQIAFMRRQTASVATARRLGASTQAQQISSAGTSALISGIGQAAQTAYQQGYFSDAADTSLKITG